MFINNLNWLLIFSIFGFWLLAPESQKNSDVLFSPFLSISKLLISENLQSLSVIIASNTFLKLHIPNSFSILSKTLTTFSLLGFSIIYNAMNCIWGIVKDKIILDEQWGTPKKSISQNKTILFLAW